MQTVSTVLIAPNSTGPVVNLGPGEDLLITPTGMLVGWASDGIGASTVFANGSGNDITVRGSVMSGGTGLEIGYFGSAGNNSVAIYGDGYVGGKTAIAMYASNALVTNDGRNRGWRHRHPMRAGRR